MTVVVAAGLGVGLALLGIRAGLRPAPRTAAAVLRGLDTPAAGSPGLISRRRPDHLIGVRLALALDRREWMPGVVTSWSQTAQTTVDALCGEAVLGATAGMVLPVAVVAVVSAAGVRLPESVAVWPSLVLGAVGALLPFLIVRSVAGRARRSARSAIASYLDLVVLCLAGGMGIEGALHAAAGIAEDDFSKQVESSLDLARDAGETPWDALAELGERLGVTELSELAAAVRLAGTEGARIRSTLAVKAASIRRHELAEAETEANTVTERLFLPGVFLLVGFLLFVGYPAVARITGAT